MKELSSIGPHSLSEKIYRQNSQLDRSAPSRSSESAEKIEEEENEKEKPPKNPLLSETEANTLHLLFGSKRPDEMLFYGRNNIDKIHKGQFLDLKG